MKDRHGKVPAAALKAFERLMRQGGATHPPDPRLVALIGVVSNHFGKPLEVVSGFRAYTPTQYTPNSRHNVGRALDFRVQGVRNEELRDFCRTLRNAGCGYYPNSTFVHLDVRDTKRLLGRPRPPGRAAAVRKAGPGRRGHQRRHDREPLGGRSRTPFSGIAPPARHSRGAGRPLLALGLTCRGPAGGAV